MYFKSYFDQVYHCCCFGTNFEVSSCIDRSLLVPSGIYIEPTFMYVCIVTHIERVWINRVRLPILLVVS